MSRQRQPIIGVIGGGRCSRDQQEKAAAVGRYVAQNGGVIVCGGLGGTMEGAARGAAEAGGKVIGIIPSDDRGDANEFVDYVIPTGLGEARNLLVVRTADAIVAFPGAFGTLSEVAFALKIGKPVIAVGAWEQYERIVQFDDPLDAAREALRLAKGHP